MTPAETIARCRRHWQSLPPHVKARETAERLIEAVEIAEGLVKEGLREEFAANMIQRGLATGHGDSLADLHRELWSQFDEMRGRMRTSAEAEGNGREGDE